LPARGDAPFAESVLEIIGDHVEIKIGEIAQQGNDDTDKTREKSKAALANIEAIE
jgi:hypothetical protein